MPPTIKNWISLSFVTCIDFCVKIKYTKRESAAISTRYQTKCTADIDKRPPNTPVNPQIRSEERRVGKEGTGRRAPWQTRTERREERDGERRETENGQRPRDSGPI